MDRETDDQTKQQWQFRLVGIWSCYGVGQHELPPHVLRLLVQHDGPGREASSSVGILAAPAPEPPPWPGAAPPRGPVLAPSAAVTAKAMTNSNLHVRVQLGDLARMAPLLGSWQAPAARRTCSWSWSET